MWRFRHIAHHVGPDGDAGGVGVGLRKVRVISPPQRATRVRAQFEPERLWIAPDFENRPNGGCGGPQPHADRRLIEKHSVAGDVMGMLFVVHHIGFIIMMSPERGNFGIVGVDVGDDFRHRIRWTEPGLLFQRLVLRVAGTTSGHEEKSEDWKKEDEFHGKRGSVLFQNQGVSQDRIDFQNFPGGRKFPSASK